MINKVISVIMPSLNSGIYIDEAICSCISQDELLELIIFDGGSDEDTLSRINFWSQKDSRIRFYSGNDLGPADALNKALTRAKGPYIGWLNSDDKYQEKAFSRALETFDENKKYKIVYGHGTHIDEDGLFIEYYPTLRPEVGINKFQDGCFICQPTTFLKKKIFLEIGKFDINLKTCFDFDLWLRIFDKYTESDIGFVDGIQASTRIHENTITNKQYWRVNIESAYVLEKYLGKAKKHWLEQAARFIVLKQKNNAKGYLEKTHLNKNLKENTKKIYNKILDNFILKIEKTNYIKAKERFDFPKSLRILFQQRFDLCDLGFNLQINERDLCIWLIKHGVTEYPFLFEGNSQDNNIYKWLSENNLKNNSRIIQAIWDSNEDLQRITFFKKYKKLLKIFLFFRWFKYVNTNINFSSFFIPVEIKIVDKIKYLFEKKTIKNKNLFRYNQINLMGYLNYNSGIGEDLRTTYESLKFKNIKTNIIDFNVRDTKRYKNFSLQNKPQTNSNRSITIICLNPLDCTWYLSSKLESYFENKYLIGYLPWEFKKWPEELIAIFNLLDEIWVSSTFILESLDEFKKPKLLMPLCVEYDDINLEPFNKSKKNIIRDKFKIPRENLVFLCSFDLESYVERKNPWGAINSFQRAFNPDYPNSSNNQNVNLIIKTFKPLANNRDWEKLKNIAKLDKRIIIIEEDLLHKDLINLYGCCDVLVSLHRSEGFGRIIAECIMLGLEIITTNWGGNTDFCKHEFIHLVPFKLINVMPGTYPFWKEQSWADPDIKKASEYMIKIFNGKKLNSDENILWLKQFISKEMCGERYKNRIDLLNNN